ncbi:hypothetical protein LRP88_13829 [Fusarium phalaenopsidis]|nr:hypothetical protein NCS56_00250900 [Fusarium sp. Ph1]
MRFSYILPFLGSSAWAAPAPSPFDDAAVAELARRAAVTPGITVTLCSVMIKGDPAWQSFKANDVSGTMYIVNGIRAPAGNKNGDNPYDVVLRSNSPGLGAVSFTTNGFLNNFPYSIGPAPSVDYVRTSGTGITYRADIDYSNSPSRQPHTFTTAISILKDNVYGPWGPVTTYSATEGYLVMNVTSTGKDTRSIYGAIWFRGVDYSFYMAWVTGSCFGNTTVPAMITTQ